MDAYHNRINEEGPEIMRNQIPRISVTFESILNTEAFQMANMEKVKEYTQQSCNLVVTKREELRQLKVKEMENKPRNKNNDLTLSPNMEESIVVVTRPNGSKKRKLTMTDRQSSEGSSNTSSGDSDEEDSDDGDIDTIDDDVIRRADNSITVAVAQLKCNPHISQMIDALKPHLREVSDRCNVMRLWLKLLIPQMQDGNNFGVEIQNEILDYVKRLEQDSNTTMQTLSIYHLTRAEIIAKFCKYPGVMDFHVSLVELDTKQFLTLRLIAREMRNSCFALTDMFEKNVEKITKPRNNAVRNMLVC